MTISCRIGPGVAVALAFLDAADPSRVVVYGMPEANKKVEPTELVGLIRRHAPVAAVVEREDPKPANGCLQSF